MSTLPPGTFRIDREGAWRHEGQEVTHPGVLRNLYANLRAEGDAHYLEVGPNRVPVTVEDAPFVVVRVEIRPDAPGSLWLHLSDGSLAAWLQLAERLEGEPGGDRATLVLGNSRILLTRRD
jgi:hypothetical protein